mmetsp:Transcript_11535/g.22115  ORF Transcript_11535/g.22115 Transcript_11535/m.22115 type:complete len:554 (-) Transcript_11535:227-1888(-)
MDCEEPCLKVWRSGKLGLECKDLEKKRVQKKSLESGIASKNSQSVKDMATYERFGGLRPIASTGRLQEMTLDVQKDNLDGISGTYLVNGRDDERKRYIFKPNDEEPYDEVMGPSGTLTRVPKKEGIQYGQTGIKEFAAYVLDAGWAGVPPTTLVAARLNRKQKTRSLATLPSTGKYIPPWKRRAKTADSKSEMKRNTKGDAKGLKSLMVGNFALRSVSEETGKRNKERQAELEKLRPMKYGSLQSYVPHIGDCEDRGPAYFLKFSAEDVHRIGVLDIRLLNLDRHLGNILVTERKMPLVTDHSNAGESPVKLVPIDHAYILPHFKHTCEARFEWLQFQQAKQPFSEETKRYIEALNPFQDAAKLKIMGIGDGSALTLIISTLFLQHCTKKGMNLHQIGSMIQRTDPMMKKESVLEEVIQTALARFNVTPVDGTTRSPLSLSAHRLNSSYDLRWSRGLNMFLEFINEAIVEKIGYDEAEILSPKRPSPPRPPEAGPPSMSEIESIQGRFDSISLTTTSLRLRETRRRPPKRPSALILNSLKPPLNAGRSKSGIS